jgi:hypothetical protein
MNLARASGAFALMALGTVASAQWLDGASDRLTFDIRVVARESATPMVHVAVRDLETGRLSHLPSFPVDGRGALNISEQRPWSPAVCTSAEAPPLGLCVNIVALADAPMTTVDVHVLASRHRVPIHVERSRHLLASGTVSHPSAQFVALP